MIIIKAMLAVTLTTETKTVTEYLDKNPHIYL